MISLDSALRRHAAADPGRIALLYEDAIIPYSELIARVDLLAAHLCGLGMAPGSIVAALMKNSPAFIELALAVSRMGGIFLPINYRLSPAEVGFILEHSGAHCLFIDDELSAEYYLPIPTVVLDAPSRNDSSVVAGGGPRATVGAPCVQPDSVFRLMYTSGTTDRPKGVVHTYGNFFWKCLDHAIILNLSAADRLLICGPLYHVGAFDLPGLAVLLFGGSLCLQRDFQPAEVLRAIDRYGVTGAWMAPAMTSRILSEPKKGLDLSSFRWCVGGGERTPEERIRQFSGVFPAGRYIDSYGLTETCSGDTFMPEGRELEKIGSVGTAVPHVCISIRDDDGAELAPGRQGEIWIKGPKVTPGYWRDTERTEASFFEGWFRTGDIGDMDTDGYLTLRDRKKDMIISGGENIASSEIERVILLLPEVSEAAVVAVPDRTWGERPLAVVVLHPGASLRAERLLEHCARHLARFKMPAGLVVRNELPRTATGKVLKRQIKEELLRDALAASPGNHD